ncbi:hypothetical protein M422DRAFT_240682 [Sphaerobolus stellatus SS14]|nr:hypothetical protein M422DRAFT_240682 [Sphaerobolus stellatus SS14]
MHSDISTDDWWVRRWNNKLPMIMVASIDNTFKRQRGFEPVDLILALRVVNWSRKEVSKEMHAWWKVLDEETFMNGGVVEKFMWSHALTLLDDSLLKERDRLFEVTLLENEEEIVIGHEQIVANSSQAATPEQVIMAVRKKKEEQAGKDCLPLLLPPKWTSARLGSKPPSAVGSVYVMPLKRKANVNTKGGGGKEPLAKKSIASGSGPTVPTVNATGASR